MRHLHPQPQTTLERCQVAKIKRITGLPKKVKSRFKGRSGEKERRENETYRDRERKKEKKQRQR